MTEINTNMPAKPVQPKAEKKPEVTNAQANSLQGLASGLNTQKTIDTIIQVEKRRLQPVEHRKAETQVNLDAFDLVKKHLEELQANAKSLAERAIWEGKIVESSDENVVTAVATAGAKPGKHTLVVDKLALNHQIASQGFDSSDVTVGTGSFKITVGEGSPVNVVLDKSNDTLDGLASAINNATSDVNATVIKTGNKKKPYQLVLTSQKTGSEGRISLEIDLKDGEAPRFENYVDEPSDWKGVGPEAPAKPALTGVGASTAISRVVGEYTGEEDHTFTFTAVQTGQIGGENALQLRWQDETGRSGVMEVDSFNYAPGEPIEFADGLSLILSQGEVIVGDTFTVRARAEKSSLYWWLDPGERSAAYTQPSPWQRQAKFGKPVIEGPYTGSEEKKFTLTVDGSGQIGGSANLALRWQADDGQSGTLRVGQGYEPGTKMALTDGITIALNPGVLTANSTATFTAVPSDTSAKWWLDDAEREIPSKIVDISNFEEPFVPEEEKAAAEFAAQPEFPEELGPRRSAVDREISGTFEGDEPKVYTFTVLQNGTVGTTKGLQLRWEDDKGNSGTVRAGDQYKIGTPQPFDSGLSIAFGSGRVFEGDSFTVRTRTSTIQPAQDAKIRFGATELGGGLEITNTTNELDDVIDGVKLNLVAVSEKPVTITISGDTDKAVESVLDFAKQFNQIITIMNELTKFDPETQQAGPLLGDRDLTDIRDQLTRRIMDPVKGLPQTLNMLFPLGLKLNDKGLLNVEEETLRNKIADDFGAVADVFRNKGDSNIAGVSFISMTDDTPASPDGMDVDVTQTATQAEYVSPQMIEPIVVDRTNDTFLITVDGTQSEEIKLTPGTYPLSDYARELQNQITNDKTIGNRRVRVLAENGRIHVISGRFGSKSSIAFSGPPDGRHPPAGLTGGENVEGLDVVGTIDGDPAEGTGRLLKGSDDSKTAAGVRLLVTLAPNQLVPEVPEAKIKITRGIGGRLAIHLKSLLDPDKGNMKRITDNLRDQIKNIDKQLDQMNERIDAKRKRLQDKFNRLESQMSKLKSQQNYLSGQMASLPTSGRGGGAGLPGL